MEGSEREGLFMQGGVTSLKIEAVTLFSWGRNIKKGL
jgi:hypothetical protein